MSSPESNIVGFWVPYLPVPTQEAYTLTHWTGPFVMPSTGVLTWPISTMLFPLVGVDIFLKEPHSVYSAYTRYNQRPHDMQCDVGDSPFCLCVPGTFIYTVHKRYQLMFNNLISNISLLWTYFNPIRVTRNHTLSWIKSLNYRIAERRRRLNKKTWDVSKTQKLYEYNHLIIEFYFN